MSHKTHWILVALMGMMIISCSEKRLVPPCPLGFTDLINAGSTETMLVEQLAGNAVGEVWKKFREEMTPYQKCLYDRCNGKDEACVRQEVSDAQMAWLGRLNDTFIAIRPLDALILLLIFLIMIRHVKFWVIPKREEPWWLAKTLAKSFLLFFVAYLLIIPVRWEVTGTIAFWIYLVALLGIIVIPHFRRQAEEEEDDEEYEEEEDDEELIDNMETIPADSDGGDDFW